MYTQQIYDSTGKGVLFEITLGCRSFRSLKCPFITVFETVGEIKDFSAVLILESLALKNISNIRVKRKQTNAFQTSYIL